MRRKQMKTKCYQNWGIPPGKRVDESGLMIGLFGLFYVTPELCDLGSDRLA